ncbi:MAG: hypothetical protein ACKPKO_04835, partial [Candidatus Fonsibacter sp.]
MYLANIASSGTEDKSKWRWQFSVRLLKKPPHSNATFLERIQGVFGIRAVVGHTGMPCLEDDRLMVSAQSLSRRDVPFVVHNTRMVNLPSTLMRGLIPGGGQTDAVQSQLSAFHIRDDRIQESSRARTTDAVIFFNLDAVKHLLMVTMSGVLVTRHTLPVSAIARIWVYRSVPLMDNRGGHRSWI